jgi:two-component system, OmpR family, sensor kinase
MRALPIRLRLTLPFALAMAFVLAAMGFFVYLRVGRALLTSIDQNLRAQAGESAGHLEHGRSLLDRDAASGVTAAQLVAPDGRVLESVPARLPSLSSAAIRARVRDGTPVWWNSKITGRRDEWRLLAVPARARGARAVLVVAQTLAPREDALRRLARELVLGGPAALALAILAGYLLAAAALRPVEAMRRRAAAITASTPGRRLPIPSGGDEISKLAETLNDMLQRLEAAFEHERRFVADASHELRTPLALLRTEIELALRRPRSPDELEQALRSAAEETERLTRLAEELLLIARSDQNGLPVQPRQLSAQSLLEGVAARYSGAAQELGRSVSVTAETDASFEADQAKLEQALGNLVDNALAYGDGAVQLFPRLQEDRVELHVVDAGPGFPAEFVARAFDRFSRADEARSPGGAGLGLAIVELIARAHGGSAAVANRDGGGADAWITLPRAQEPTIVRAPRADPMFRRS